MRNLPQQRNWFWLTLTLSSITVVALVLALWELIENRFFRNLDYLTLHYLDLTRGIAVSLILAFWAAWFVLRERNEKEEELRRSSERYRAILDSTPSSVLLLDGSLRISECNSAAERLYGYATEELIGAVLPTLPDDRAAEMRGIVERVGHGDAVLDLETQRKSKDGKRVEVQLSVLPLRSGNDGKYFLEVTSDITERVRFQQTLLQIEKLTTMGQMAAGTAHHLNTPLASMLLRLRMMREGKFEDSLKADLERLESSVSFCQHFVQQLLRFSRVGDVDKQPQALSATLRAVTSFLGPQLLAKRIRLDLALDGCDGAVVKGDKNQLEAVFLILISNAADAVPKDGVIRVNVHPADTGRVLIEIRDNGCGIPAEVLPRIMEPFFTTKPPGVGTGLGLAIATSILEKHNGSMRFDSAPGLGTTVTVELPVAVEARQTVRSLQGVSA